jgi:hypothetical protein
VKRGSRRMGGTSPTMAKRKSVRGPAEARRGGSTGAGALLPCGEDRFGLILAAGPLSAPV